MLEPAVLVPLISGAITVSIGALTLVLSRPISLLWEGCWKRRDWPPLDVKSQTPRDPNCQGRSDRAEGGSNGEVTDPAAPAVEDVTRSGVASFVSMGQWRVGPTSVYLASWRNSFPPSVTPGPRSH